MIPMKPTLLGTTILLAATLGSAAQAQYPAYAQAAPYWQYQQPPQLPATPPSWSYNPYTSGLGPCIQKGPLDLGKCADQMPPNYGQWSYGQPIYPPGSR